MGGKDRRVFTRAMRGGVVLSWSVFFKSMRDRAVKDGHRGTFPKY